MSKEAKFALIAVGFVLLFFGFLIGGLHYESRMIAKSPDPLSTACALGREKACTALAARK